MSGIRGLITKGRDQEEGSALILALVFMLVIAVGLGALLYMGQASFLATQAVRAQASSAYSVDGAVNTAINNIRHASDANGTLEGTVPSQTAGVNNCPTITVTVNGILTRVDCQGTNKSGLVAADNPSNDPQYAILTLAPATSSVVGISQGSNNNITIGGPVRANSEIDLQNADTWVVTGTVSTDRCGNFTDAAHITTVPAGGPACNIVSPVPDPGSVTSTFASMITTTAAPSVMPKCTNGATIFSPGAYTKASQLNPVGGCTSGTTTAIFNPGVYYLDFSTGSNTWTDPFNSIIGGTANAVGSAATDCLSGKPGVQWVFGEDTHFVLQSNAGSPQTMHLCPIISQTQQQIVIYGVTQTNTPVAGVKAESGCIIAAAPCNLLDVSGAGAQLVLKGTVYAPLATVNVKLQTNANQAIFGRGVICYSLIMDLTGGVSPAAGVIGIPPALGTSPAPGPRTVLFTATVNGKVKLKAIAQFDDTNLANPGRQVTVTAWSVYR